MITSADIVSILNGADTRHRSVEIQLKLLRDTLVEGAAIARSRGESEEYFEQAKRALDRILADLNKYRGEMMKMFNDVLSRV